MGLRKCHTCHHRDSLLTGRCTHPTGSASMCGCVCGPESIPNAAYRTSHVETILRAFRHGHTWGIRVMRDTGLPEKAVYCGLRQLLELG